MTSIQTSDIVITVTIPRDQIRNDSQVNVFDELLEAYNKLERRFEHCKMQRNALVVFPGLNNSIEELDAEIERIK